MTDAERERLADARTLAMGGQALAPDQASLLEREIQRLEQRLRQLELRLGIEYRWAREGSR